MNNFLWIQSGTSDNKDILFDHMGKIIKSNSPVIPSIDNEISLLLNKGKEIYNNKETSVRKLDDNYLLQFYTNHTDEQNRLMPALYYFHWTNNKKARYFDDFKKIYKKVQYDDSKIKNLLHAIDKYNFKIKIKKYLLIIITITILSLIIISFLNDNRKDDKNGALKWQQDALEL